VWCHAASSLAWVASAGFTWSSVAGRPRCAGSPRCRSRSPPSRGERACARAEKHESRDVRRSSRDVPLGVERVAELVRGEDVPAAVPHVRRYRGHRVEDPLHARPDPLLRPATGAHGDVARPGQVQQVGTLGLVELQRSGERGDEGAVRIKELTEGVGADAVLECVGTGESLLQALRSIPPGDGRLGWCPARGGSADAGLVLAECGRARRTRARCRTCWTWCRTAASIRARCSTWCCPWTRSPKVTAPWTSAAPWTVLLLRP